jgi:hypothetical protein
VPAAGKSGLDDVVAELYALAPEDFTATRDARAKDARAEGDTETATRIRKLTKPSTAAWLVNMLVRHQHDELQQLLDVGAALREATTAVDADQLKELNRQAHRVVSAVSRQARALAAELDHPVSEAIEWQVDQTLRAALADSEAADAVASGQLVKALEPNGFGPVDVSGATADPSGVQAAPRRRLHVVHDAPSDGDADRGAKQKDTTDAEARAKAKAEVALREARERAEAAEQDDREAQERLAAQTKALDDARSRRDEIADEVARLREQLAQCEQQAARAENDVRAAERLQRKVKQVAEAARRQAAKAREQLDRATAPR